VLFVEKFCYEIYNNVHQWILPAHQNNKLVFQSEIPPEATGYRETRPAILNGPNGGSVTITNSVEAVNYLMSWQEKSLANNPQMMQYELTQSTDQTSINSMSKVLHEIAVEAKLEWMYNDVSITCTLSIRITDNCLVY
jgi:hypothetical protein